MFRKGQTVKCKTAQKGLTVGRNYVVTRERWGQSVEYDRIEVTNDAGVIRQSFPVSLFVATDEEPSDNQE